MGSDHQDNGGRAYRGRVFSARRDLVTGGITLLAILLFVLNGGAAVGGFVRWLAGVGPAADRLLAAAVLLNVALLLFGWRRYRDLTAEVAERTAAEALARALADHDPLTGFLNRRALFAETEALLAAARRTGSQVAALVVDLDHFKKVNDVHGHAAGDELLRRAAAVIGDILPPDARTARLGGDEFACVLSQGHGAEAALAAADRIAAALARPLLIGAAEVRVCASVGVTLSVPGETIDPGRLLRQADIAMYVAKQRGGSRSCLFEPAMEEALAQRIAAEADMRRGLADGEFVPFYEQQIELDTGRLTGFEVLARWRHPSAGVLPPDTFLPLAVETGLMGELCTQVIRRALEEARGWSAELSLSVNISADQLRDPWLAQKLLKLLFETGFPPERLEIEVTEAALFEDLSLTRSTIASLKNQGVRLALDDFGAGPSSLANLRALPFDRIKIDRSFVSAIGDGGESAAMVNAIAKLGENLGVPVVAEGVETGRIAHELQRMGLLKGQGWHYGRPLDTDGARLVLAERGLLPTASPEEGSRPRARRTG